MMGSGSLAGFPVVDVKATLYDGSYHDVDSSVLAFQIAARMAFREGMKKAGVQLLEPLMKVGGDCARRRARGAERRTPACPRRRASGLLGARGVDCARLRGRAVVS
jgi:hypothetical protein